MRLAELTGFKQAHISNFLNRKRGLSLEGMDKVLQVEHLSVLDLLDPAEVNKRASIFPPNDDEFDNVIVVDSDIAASEAVIMGMHIKEILKFKKSFLKRLKPDAVAAHTAWERFVVVKLDHQEAMVMYPRTLPGAALLIDRHYTSLTPYRKEASNIYAVRKNDGCVIRHLEVIKNQLILRPHNRNFPIEVISLEDGQKPADYIVGRICHIGTDT